MGVGHPEKHNWEAAVTGRPTRLRVSSQNHHSTKRLGTWVHLRAQPSFVSMCLPFHSIFYFAVSLSVVKHLFRDQTEGFLACVVSIKCPESCF